MMDVEKMETSEVNATAEDQINESDDSELCDSDDDDEQRRATASALNKYTKSLEKNPYNYSLHEEFIKFLEKGDDLVKLREARENMAKLFPLTPELWLTWIRQEIDLCLDEEEKLKVLELFQRAVKDYTSVNVWLEYCQFAIGFSDTNGGFERARAVFEEACNKVGLHVQQGALIFEAYREFELAIYSTMPVDNESSEKQVNAKEKQRQKILALFRRQLSVPLFDMEKTLEELRSFSSEAVNTNLTLSYRKALKLLEEISPFEKELCSLETRTFADYEAYIDFEIKKGDAARVQILFERAVTDDCLRVELWEKYLKYMDFTLKIDSLALPVHERSIRNVPWSSSLWVSYMTCLERMSASVERVETVLEEAKKACISTGTDALNLWIFYLSYIRRGIDFKEPQAASIAKLRTKFEQAESELSNYDLSFEEGLEPLLYYWATVEANLGNLQHARELWLKITRQGASSQAKTWLNYANFENTYGDFKHYRKVLQRGLYATVDWPEQIGEQWLQAELQQGTLEGLQEAQSKYEARMLVINEKREKAAARELLQAQNTSNEDRQRTKKRKATKSPEKDNSFEDKKGKWSNLDKDGFRQPLPVSNPVEKSTESFLKPADDDPLREAQTIFLSNLAYEVEEEKIREVFKDVGQIEELRLVRDYKHRCKGFGYLVFGDISSVEAALKKDRVPIDGRPVFVSRCNQRKEFGFHLGLEKNKIFVKNIPFDATKEELETIFKQCGPLAEVRLCVLRNGKFKGMAYVDFVDDASASTAVVKLDGFDMRGKNLSVAISNPPIRKEKAHNQAPQQKSKESSMKTRLFVPRSVQTKGPSTTQPGTSSEKTEPARSNDDFRNLFLKK